MAATTFDGSPLEIAPPLPPNPIAWRRAWRLLGELIDDPEATEKVFEIMDAVGGRGHERFFQRFAAHPEGRALLRERPSLVDAMADHAALAALPAGTLGRTYLDFALARRFAADGLVEINHAQHDAESDPHDEHRRFYFDRVTAMHDLWHVLTGYGTDEAGEATLLAFTFAQLPSRGIGLIVVASLFLLPRSEKLRCQRYLLRAWLRGRRASPLHLAHWEELLSLPLDEARRRLRVEAPGEAHPSGILVGRPDDEARWVPA